MTILADTSRVIGVATGAGRSWFFPFRFYADAHIAVFLLEPGTFNWIEILPADYTIEPGPGTEQDGWLGGTVTYPKAPAAVLPEGWKLRINLAIPYTQPNIDLTNASGFDPRAVEREFDLGVQRAQQLRDESQLHLRLPEGSVVQPEIVPPDPGHLVMLDEYGTRFVGGPDGAAIALVAELAEEILAMENRTVPWFPPVVAATTGNHGLSGLSAVDGVTPAAGDRILVRVQSTPAQNGIYIAALGAWTRAVDLNGSAPIIQGTRVIVYGGDTQAQLTYALTSANPVVVGTSDITFALAELYNFGKPLVVETDVTVQIPSDFATLQAAVDFYSAFIVKQGVRITLNIETGHQPETGLLVQNGDFAHFYVASADAVVTLSPDFVGVGALPDIALGPTDGQITSGCFIMANNARGPVLGTIIDGNGLPAARTGYFAIRNATGRADRPAAPTEEAAVLPPIAGCINFKHACAQAQENSMLVWENALATGSGLNGLYAERSSIIYAEFADASNAAQTGMIAARASTITASTSKANNCRIGYWALRACTINADESEATGCKDYGYYAVFGSTINAHLADASGALGTGNDATFGGAGFLAYHASRINAFGADASGCAKYGVLARDRSDIGARGSDLSGCGVSAAYATDASTIQAEGADASNAGGDALDVDSASTLNANGVIATGAGASAVRCRTGSRANVDLATLTGATAHGVYADLGSSVNAAGANVSGAGAAVVRVNHGSFINISNGTTSAGNPGVPQAADTNVGALNTLSGNGAVFHIT